MGTGNWTPVLCKYNACSSSPSHLSSPMKSLSETQGLGDAYRALRPGWQFLTPWARPAETALHEACSKEGIKSQHTLSPCWTCNHGNHSLPLEAFSWVLAQQPRSCNPPLDSPALRQSCSGRASADPALTSHRGNVGKSGIRKKKCLGATGTGREEVKKNQDSHPREEGFLSQSDPVNQKGEAHNYPSKD